LSKWAIPIICLMLVAAGGTGCKKPKDQQAPKTPNPGLKTSKIVFQSYDINKAPEKVKLAVEQNKAKETASLLEDGGSFWVLLTRGLKPTGGFSVKVTDVDLGTLDNGSTELKVSYKYTDPRPDQFVTQVLTYPVELVLLKDLTGKPDNVVFLLVK